ncbi:MAG TPA: hypothetical protein G4O00_06170 [Thermoflexia bacterium]|nr:hypothetical protein [Thermoflexia bacterium]
MGTPQALLAADTDRTQDYVFESARLPEIRGASRQLDDLDRRAANLVRQRGGQVILSGGGRLLAIVPLDEAEALALEVEKEYVSETRVATTTVDWRPLPPGALEQGYPPDPGRPFGTLMNWIEGWLRRKKESRETVPFWESLPHTERCRSCQVRPVSPATLQKYPDWPLCDVCYAKRTYEGRFAWFHRFQGFLKRNPDLERRYYAGESPFPDSPADAGKRFARHTPQDLTEIGEACGSREGYVGFIYLDGDDMGEVFARLPTWQACAGLSQAVQKAAEEAVLRALAIHLHPAWVFPSPARASVDEMPSEEERDELGRMRIHPFEIITVGGDDVMLIVPADRAIPIAAEIARGFQAGVAKRFAAEGLSHPLTMSGGVVLAADHNPVRVLRDLAKELAVEAKRARREAGAGEGYLDFLVLRSADILDRRVARLRGTYPYTLPVPGRKPLSLLGRPYPASTLQAIWEELHHLRRARFPASQMHLLAEALLRGRREATLFYLYQKARDKGGGFAHLDRILEVARNPDDEPGPLPWSIPPKRMGYSYRTALWDVAELYTFVS